MQASKYTSKREWMPRRGEAGQPAGQVSQSGCLHFGRFYMGSEERRHELPNDNEPSRGIKDRGVHTLYT